MMTKLNTCLIVGGGISGLMAGTVLQANQIETTLLDKGRGFGGRMANRRMRLSDGRADHGAQFFTVRSPTFQAFVDAWLEAGVAAEWTRGFGSHDGHPRYRGVPGMTAIPKHLAQTLTVHRETKATRIQHTAEGWLVDTENGRSFSADALLMTSPTPQSLALLESVELPAEVIDPLRAVQYDPCFAVMVTLNGESGIPAPGGVQVRGEPIAWIADNRQKGVSSTTTVTIHAGPAFTMSHLDQDREQVGRELIAAAAAAGYLNGDQVTEMQVHRWLYAQPSVLHPERTLLTDHPAPLAFAGDAFYEARVEGAALSGLAAAEALLQLANIELD